MFFKDLAAAGFGPDLIPILPPDAVLWANSADIESKRGKVPGKLVAGKWVGFGAWTQHTASPGDIERWEKWNCGAGIQCRRVVAIDIDVDDADLAARIVRFAFKALGDSYCRNRLDSPRTLLLYRLPDGVRLSKRRLAFTDPAGTQHAVEMLGNGQQFVAKGRHPKGVGSEYYWDSETAGKGLPTFAGLTIVLPEALDAFFSDLAEGLEGLRCKVVTAGGQAAADRASRSQASLVGDADVVKTLLTKIPNTLAYDDWIRLSVAVKAAAGDLAYDAWLTWCLQWPQNTPALCEEKWDSFKPPYAVGYEYILDQAQKAGLNIAALDFGGTLEDALVVPASLEQGVTACGSQPPSTIAPAGAAKDGPDTVATPGLQGNGDNKTQSGPSSSPAPPSLPDVADEDGWYPKEYPEDLNPKDRTAYKSIMRGWCYVLDVKRFFNVFTGACVDEDQFNTQHRFAGPRNRSQKSPANCYLNNRRARVLQGITYQPDGKRFESRISDGAECFNIWRPSKAVIPKGVTSEDVAPWLELLEYLVPDLVERETLLDWMAFTLQKPGIKINWGVLLGGAQGIGKDTLMKPVRVGLGEHNTRTVGVTELSGSFTSWLEAAKLIVVNEVFSTERKETINRLKPLLAAPPDTLMINKKFVAAYEIPNLINFFMCTNYPDALTIEDDDRRVFVLWSHARPWAPEAYGWLNDWLDKGGGSLRVAGWLMGRDVRGFDCKGRAPTTESKKQMMRLTMGGLETWITEGLEDQSGVFAHNLTSVELILASLPEDVWRLRPTREKISSLLQRRGCRKLSRLRDELGQRITLWSIRDHRRLANLESRGLRAEYDAIDSPNRTQLFK